MKKWVIGLIFLAIPVLCLFEETGMPWQGSGGTGDVTTAQLATKMNTADIPDTLGNHHQVSDVDTNRAAVYEKTTPTFWDLYQQLVADSTASTATPPNDTTKVYQKDIGLGDTSWYCEVKNDGVSGKDSLYLKGDGYPVVVDQDSFSVYIAHSNKDSVGIDYLIVCDGDTVATGTLTLTATDTGMHKYTFPQTGNFTKNKRYVIRWRVRLNNSEWVKIGKLWSWS